MEWKEMVCNVSAIIAIALVFSFLVLKASECNDDLNIRGHQRQLEKIEMERERFRLCAERVPEPCLCTLPKE